MSGICEIFPDDPSCVVEEVAEPVVEEEAAAEEVVEGGDEEEGAEEGAEEEAEEEAAPAAKMDHGAAAGEAVAKWTWVKDMASMAELDPAAGNMGLFGAALGWTVYSALEAFRYRSNSKYYDGGKIGDDTNYWKLSEQIRLFGGLGLGGLLTVTSLMALVGGGAVMNVQMWELGMMIGALLGGIVGVMRFLGYEAAYSQATGTDVLKIAQGAALMTTLETAAIEDAAMNAGFMMTVWMAMESAHYGAWNAMTDEQQAEKIAAWEETIATRAEAVAAKRATAAPAAEAEEEEEAEEEGEEAEEGEEGEEAAEEGEEAEEEAAEE